MDVSGERYVSPVPRVWDRPRPFYGCVGCVRARIHTYTYTGGVGEGKRRLRRLRRFVETMHSSIHVYFRKGPTVAVQPRLPRRYLLGVREGGVQCDILYYSLSRSNSSRPINIVSCLLIRICLVGWSRVSGEFIRGVGGR